MLLLVIMVQQPFQHSQLTQKSSDCSSNVQLDTTLNVSSDLVIAIDQQTETLAIEGVDGEIDGVASGNKTK